MMFCQWGAVAHREIFDNRAIRPLIAVAMLDQMLQLVANRLQLFDILIEFGHMLACQLLDFDTLAGRSVIVERTTA